MVVVLTWTGSACALAIGIGGILTVWCGVLNSAVILVVSFLTLR